jgi:hypothetical protein
MIYKTDEQMIEELNQMIHKKTLKSQARNPSNFLLKTGISIKSCRIHYKQIEERDKIKEKIALSYNPYLK